jgi:hypothetical protein
MFYVPHTTSGNASLPIHGGPQHLLLASVEALLLLVEALLAASSLRQVFRCSYDLSKFLFISNSCQVVLYVVQV